MSEQMKERLSSLVDSELGDIPVDDVVQALEQDADLRGQWARFHLIRDVLDNNLAVGVDAGFAERVSAALAAEPTVLSPRHHTLSVPPVLKQVASLALAASVTAVAILGVQQYRGGVEVVPAVDTVASTAPVATPQPQQWIRAAGVSWDVQEPTVESKLNAYLVDHQGYSSGMRGILPYARIVSYDVNRGGQRSVPVEAGPAVSPAVGSGTGSRP